MAGGPVVERVRETMAKLPSAKAVIAAVLFIAGIASTGTLALSGVFSAPTDVRGLQRDLGALKDSTSLIRDVQLEVLGRLDEIEVGHDITIRAIARLEAAMDSLTASASGLECVVLLELPPRTCLSRIQRR